MSDPLAFITGASSGIGQALAARFHRAGFRLALVARRADEVARWAATQGIEPARCAIYAADVRDIAAITAAGRECIETHTQQRPVRRHLQARVPNLEPRSSGRRVETRDLPHAGGQRRSHRRPAREEYRGE